MAGSEQAPQDIPRAQQQLFDAPGGARAKYSALVVGRSGLGALLKYELVVLLSQHVPGALGLALRKWLYPTLLGSCGRNVIFGQNDMFVLSWIGVADSNSMRSVTASRALISRFVAVSGLRA